MERMDLRKMLFIRYGLLIVFLTAIIVFSLLWVLRVDDMPLLDMIIAYFFNQSIS